MFYRRGATDAASAGSAQCWPAGDDHRNRLTSRLSHAVSAIAVSAIGVARAAVSPLGAGAPAAAGAAFTWSR